MISKVSESKKQQCKRCDTSGPTIYGTYHGTVVKRAQGLGATDLDWAWCSVSCSKCGLPHDPELLKGWEE